MVEFALRHNRPDLAEWVVAKFPAQTTRKHLMDDHRSPCILRGMASNGSLEALKWVHQNYGLTKKEVIESTAFVRAARGGHAAMVQWLCETFRILRYEVADQIPDILSSGHQDVANYLHGLFGLQMDDLRGKDNILLAKLCSSGKLDTIKWIHQNIPGGWTKEDVGEMSFRPYNMAQEKQHPDVVQWLEDTFEIDPDVKSIYHDG